MTQLWSVTCHMGSPSVTFHPTQVNTPRLNFSQTGRYSIYLARMAGRLSWPNWLDRAPAGSRTSDLQSRVRRSMTAPPRQLDEVSMRQERPPTSGYELTKKVQCWPQQQILVNFSCKNTSAPSSVYCFSVRNCYELITSSMWFQVMFECGAKQYCCRGCAAGSGVFYTAGPKASVPIAKN